MKEAIRKTVVNLRNNLIDFSKNKKLKICFISVLVIASC